MTAGPNRSTVAGARYRDLRNLARRTRRPTDELLQLYALEGFLERLLARPAARAVVTVDVLDRSVSATGPRMSARLTTGKASFGCCGRGRSLRAQAPSMLASRLDAHEVPFGAAVVGEIDGA